MAECCVEYVDPLGPLEDPLESGIFQRPGEQELVSGHAEDCQGVDMTKGPGCHSNVYTIYLYSLI